jgi:hypothetical protein
VPRLAAAFASASLDPAANHWDRVFDFSKDDVSLPTPHWAPLPEGAWEEWVVGDLGPAHGAPEAPVPRRGAPPPRAADSAGFDIRAGPAAAQAALDAAAEAEEGEE